MNLQAMSFLSRSLKREPEPAAARPTAATHQRAKARGMGASRCAPRRQGTSNERPTARLASIVLPPKLASHDFGKVEAPSHTKSMKIFDSCFSSAPASASEGIFPAWLSGRESTVNRSIKLSLVFGVALAAAAVAQTPPESFVPLPITEPRNAAVGYALTHAQFVNSLLGTCARLDESTSTRAKLTWASWQSRNWPHVEAARGWLQYVRAIASSQQGQEAGAAIQSKVLSEMSTNARLALLDVLPGGEPQVAACDKWLQLVSDPRIDLRASKEFGHDLEHILAFHRAVLDRAPRN